MKQKLNAKDFILIGVPVSYTHLPAHSYLPDSTFASPKE